MAHGYIKSFRLDEDTFSLSRCRFLAPIDRKELFEQCYEVAVADLLGLYEDALSDNSRRSDRPAEQQITFRDDLNFPSGAYEAVLSTRFDVRQDERDYGDDWPKFSIINNKFVIALRAEGTPQPFYEMVLDFVQVHNALTRYRGYVRRHEREVESATDLDNLIYADLNREEGHEGIIASLFPDSFNFNRRWRLKTPPDYTVDFAFGCRLFEIFRVLFPRGPFSDANYGLKENKPAVAEGTRPLYMGPKLKDPEY